MSTHVTTGTISEHCALGGVHEHGPYMVVPPAPTGTYAVKCPCCGLRGWDHPDNIEPMPCPDCLIPAAPALDAAAPTVVCLCGSTRFEWTFETINRRETLAGKIVLAPGVFGAAEHTKPALDELHLRKIDLADEVLVINVDGYIGESTRREIAYAQEHGKPVRYLETQDQP